jgi:hypothetical protein
VAVDDALDGGEPDAGAFELVLAVEPLERAEELAGVASSKPAPLSRT